MWLRTCLTTSALLAMLTSAPVLAQAPSDPGVGFDGASRSEEGIEEEGAPEGAGEAESEPGPESEPEPGPGPGPESEGCGSTPAGGFTGISIT